MCTGTEVRRCCSRRARVGQYKLRTEAGRQVLDYDRKRGLGTEPENRTDTVLGTMLSGSTLPRAQTPETLELHFLLLFC